MKSWDGICALSVGIRVNGSGEEVSREVWTPCTNSAVERMETVKDFMKAHH